MSQGTTTYTTLNNPAFTSNTLAGINDAGEVIGYSTDGRGETNSSYSGLSYGTLPTFDFIVAPGATGTFVEGINNLGTVVGSVLLNSGEYGFIMGADGSFTQVADPAAGTVFEQFNGIDDSGHIVGVNGTPGAGVHSFIYDPASQTYTPVEDGTNATVTGIDDYGDVVGKMADGSSFLLIAGDATPIILGDPSHQIEVWANGINNEGQVVGTLIEDGHATGFVYDYVTGQYTYYFDPDGTDTFLNGINDLGQAAGSYTDAAGNGVGLIVSTTGIVSVAYPITGTTLSVPVGSGGIAVGRDAAVTLIDRTGGSAPVVLEGNAGADTLVGSPGDANGFAVADTIVSGSGNNVIFAYAGDTFLGGGDNLVVAGGTTPTIVASTGNDTLFAVGEADAVFGGSAGSLLVVGGAETSTLVAGAGNLTAFAGTAPELVYGGSGTTVLVGGGSGSDTFIGGSGYSADYTGAGGASIQGGSGSGIFVTARYGAADDSTSGGPGASTITAGLGASQIYVGNGDRVLLEGSANNVVGVSTGNATLVGGTSTGDNIFLLGSGQDQASGGKGSDTFFFGSGDATLTSGSGVDFYAVTRGVGGSDVLDGFRIGTDRLVLTAYGNTEEQTAIASQTNAGGSAVLTLSDKTTITFTGIASVGTDIFG